ncbi:MAG: efflux transporter outer membrane subunit [Acidobacteria bacterium]|nr:efflux transporter outer membrane subunit [Acidobacteriota bacterium]
MKRSLLPLVAALLLGGCSLVPKYTPPEPPVPDTWRAPEAAAAGATAVADTEWREFFTDEKLRSIIGAALENNRDLRVATLNVQRAQELYRIQRSELNPGIGVQAIGDINRVPEKTTGTGHGRTAETYTVLAGTLNWEIDFFGRLRSLKEAALEQYLATREGAGAAQIALVSAVARTYLALAADAENLQIARGTLEAQQATFDLIRQSSELGIASDVDMRQAQSQVNASRADVAHFTGLVAVDRNALELLAGTPLGDELLPAELAEVASGDALAPGIPSEVLLRRPDILAAEHQLKAFNANIGAARAAYFPRISLTAGAGTLSNDLSDLFSQGTGTWTFTGQLLTPIFASGSLRAGVRAAQVDREIAVAQYERTIQAAFAEVSDSLTLRRTLVDQRDALEDLVFSLSETFRLSEARYNAGLDGYLNVLVAQRSLFAAQQALVQAQFAEQANLVTLYAALGGGRAAATEED